MRPPAFAAAGRWFAGNLHTHSDRSDGMAPPGEVVAAYRAAGYDFLVLTDHFEARCVHGRCSPARAIALTGIHGWRSAVAEGDPTITEATLDLGKLRSPYWRLTVTAADGARAWTNPVWS